MQLGWACEILVQEMSMFAENRSFESDIFLVLGAVLGCCTVGVGGSVEHKGCLVAVSSILQGLANAGIWDGGRIGVWVLQ